MTSNGISTTICPPWYPAPVLPDAECEKYYYPAKLNEELERGFEKFNKFDDHDEHLDSLLASIQRYEESQGNETKVDIVTWRGMMTKIMTVPPPRLRLTLIVDPVYEE
jgi:23S rRNA A2030 N6-methylase RlmJ